MVKHKNNTSKSVLDTGFTSDGKTFDKLIGEKPAFVKFYSPMCGHCQNMANDWKKLGDDIGNIGIYIIEAHVDGLDKITSKCKEGSNNGIPYIAMVQKGGTVFKEYRGNRSLVDMMKFVKENVRALIKRGGGNKTRKQGKGRINKTRKGRKRMRR